MSYCVNCGVELDDTAKVCALCNTPVYNPKAKQICEAVPPFPEEKGQVEVVKSKDLGILLTVVMIATAVICGVLNALVFKESFWSLAVIGVCVIVWVIMIPAVIYTRQSIYVSLLYDGAAVCLYLWMISYMIQQDEWLYGLGLPIVVWCTLIIEAFTLCVRKLPKSILAVAFYSFTAIGIGIVGLEILIDWYLTEAIALTWSAIVLTICVIVDVALVTLLSRRRLRNAVRRRLHF